MFTRIRTDLEAKLKHANRLIETARQAKILSDRAICAIHSEKKQEAESLLNKARLGIKKLNKDLVKYPELYATNMQINLAFQEHAEAEILVSILAGRDLPALDVPGECYLTGLADCVGELNRSFLQFLMKKDHKRAEMVMGRALEISDLLKEFDYPDFVALNLRRKKDAVRIIVNNMLAAMNSRGISLSKRTGEFVNNAAHEVCPQANPQQGEDMRPLSKPRPLGRRSSQARSQT